jgi:gliding motility-associated-like protein
VKNLLNIFLLFSFLSFGQDNQVWMTPNHGQWEDLINYKVNIVGGDMFIENQGFTYLFDNRSEFHEHHHEKSDHNELTYRSHVIKTHFLGSNKITKKTEANFAEFYYNYFIDKNPSKWKSNIHPCSKISYAQLYDGIDFEMIAGLSSLKYSFIVQANSDPLKIQYEIKGTKNIFIDKSGNLIIKHQFGEITESKPVAWNLDEEGRKNQVHVRFKLKNQILSYEFPEGYNSHQVLVIDPNITFSSYSGSTSDNWGSTAAPDPSTNLFAAGVVFGPGYPTTAGVFDNSFNHSSMNDVSIFDVALSKFNASGSAFLYSTYIGGSNGNEIPMSLVSDNDGNLYMLGTTSSGLFPTTSNAVQTQFNGGMSVNTDEGLNFTAGTDFFILKLNETGSSLLGSTFFGGSNNDGINLGGTDKNYGDSFRGDITLDDAGNVYIAGTTNSSNFPRVNASQQVYGGVQDAVFAKFNTNLTTVLWSTYYGGSNYDAGYSIQVNDLGEVYACGGTLSSNLQTPGGNSTSLNGDVDGFIVRMNGNNSSIINATYVGTNLYDQTYFVQIDDENSIYVYGQTSGPMTITPGLFGIPTAGQFIRKYSSNLNQVTWTTKIGGPNNNNFAISPTAFLVSDCKEIYIAGWGGNILQTSISNFPVTSDAFMNNVGGDGFYIAVLTPNAAALEYATFIGGPSRDHVDGGTSRFDKSGRIYHAVCSACQGNDNGFVSTPGVIGPTNNSPNCNLAAFKFELNAIEALVTDPNYVICIPDPIQFFSNSINGEVFVWDFGDGNTSNQINPTHLYQTEGVFTVKLTVYDSLFCKVPDSTSFEIEVGSFAPGFIDPVSTICKGSTINLTAGGGSFYSWFPVNYFTNPSLNNQSVILNQTTELSVIIGDVCGSDTFSVVVNVFPDQISVSEEQSICIGGSVPVSVSGAISQIWSPNNNINNNTLAQAIVSPTSTMYYIVEATTINNCSFKDSVLIDVQTDVPQPQIEDTLRMCNGSFVEILASGGVNYTWYPNLFLNTTTGNIVISTTPNDMYYYCDFSNSCGTLTDSVYVDVIIPRLTAYGDTIICYGDTTRLIAQGAVDYYWYPSSNLTDRTNDTVYVFPQQSMNYIVTGTDEFGCVDKDTVVVRLHPRNQVELGSFIRAKMGDIIQLNAQTDVEGVFNWYPNYYISCDTCQNPTVYPNFNTQYRVYFMDKNGCVTTDFIDIIYDGILYIPNTFTPDNNKFNQIFKMYGEGIDDIHMTIFDRWGEIIRELNGMDDYWDGTYKGLQCQDGTYTWKLYYRDSNGNDVVKTGHVNLLR